jgi:DUF1009 family protein
MNKKTALLLGNGRYALDLHRRLYRKEAQIAVALYPEQRSVLAREDINEFIDIFERDRIAEYLKANGVTHVVFGGDFRQKVLEIIAREHADGPLVGVDGSHPSALVSLLGAVVLATGADGKKALTPISPSALLTDLCPGQGWIAQNGPMLEWSDERIKAHVEALRSKVLELCSAQSLHHTRQAFLFDGEQLFLAGKAGTDALLMDAAASSRPKELRTLIKLCPTECNPNWDPPVIGPRTFELAVDAFVNLAVVDGTSGILFDRTITLPMCKEVGISLYGA